MKSSPIFLTALLLSLCLQSHSGDVPGDKSAPEPLTKPGVVLTFDDRNFDDWLAALPLFEKYDAKATFFISGEIKGKALETALALKKAGHAIGSHSVHHLSAVEYLEKHSAAKFMEAEVVPQLVAFEKAGIDVTAFAYPMSKNNADTDRELLKVFRHLRTGKGIDSEQEIRDCDEFFVPAARMAEHGLLYGKGIDFAPVRGDRTFEKIDAALVRAAQNGEIITLYAHRIVPIGKGNFITPMALEHVLKKAKSLNLTFYTVDQLP